MSQTEPPDGEAVGEPSSKSYVALQNDEWERRLVGRKFVENEDEGFQDLKCLRSLGLPTEIIRIINSFYCFTRISADLPPGLDTEIVSPAGNNLTEGDYRPDRLTFGIDENGLVARVQFGA